MKIIIWIRVLCFIYYDLFLILWTSLNNMSHGGSQKSLAAFAFADKKAERLEQILQLRQEMLTRGSQSLGRQTKRAYSQIQYERNIWAVKDIKHVYKSDLGAGYRNHYQQKVLKIDSLKTDLYRWEWWSELPCDFFSSRSYVILRGYNSVLWAGICDWPKTNRKKTNRIHLFTCSPLFLLHNTLIFFHGG